jgi:hypothetical protein
MHPQSIGSTMHGAIVTFTIQSRKYHCSESVNFSFGILITDGSGIPDQGGHLVSDSDPTPAIFVIIVKQIANPVFFNCI